jgi:hypothetical protein
MELMEMPLLLIGEALRMAREGELSDGPSALAVPSYEPMLPR